MTDLRRPPDADEVEATLLGPGYGESAVLHLGGNSWMVVDSFRQKTASGTHPAATLYLESIGVNPAESVRFIVATHWHDDHIRGLSELVETCAKATFCCSAAFRREEVLAVAGALAKNEVSVTGSGVREIHAIFSPDRSTTREYALASRPLYRQGECEVWSLSPDSRVFERFLGAIRDLLPGVGKAKGRVPNLSPNETSVVLWVRVGEIGILLGGDMEQDGWTAILENSTRPVGRASVFKVPHHGAKSGHHEGVWDQMLTPDLIAVLAPWSRGGQILPQPKDVKRILGVSGRAFATVPRSKMHRPPQRRGSAVAKTIRESGIKTHRVPSELTGIRMRRRLGSASPWRVEKIGFGCSLEDF